MQALGADVQLDQVLAGVGVRGEERVEQGVHGQIVVDAHGAGEDGAMFDFGFWI